jgi:peptidyl-prolyl cis-trans isomerase B (cyclophilin B)
MNGITVADENIRGKFYNNEEYQFQFEIPYRWEPLLPKTIVDETGFEHYLLGVEPNQLHVNYYKDGVQARFLIDILNVDEYPFEKYSNNLKNYYQALEDEGLLSIADEYVGMTANGHPVHFTEYLEPYETVKGTTIAIHTRETIVANSDFVYKISYINLNDNFKREISSYNYLLEHFKFSFDGEMKSIDWGPNIIKYNPVGEPGGGGCLIATAAFGSELAPQVQFLRELRDNTVLQTESGTSFMAGFNQFYYSFSPVIADYERENPVFKEAVKLTLTPLLTSLTLLQYIDIDSESEMLGYGIGIILLNIGMYFVAPAILIMKIRTSYNKIPKNI